jgi:hypothetical protein
MKGALEAMAAQVVNVALAVFLIAIVLGLSAYLSGQPTETDALQASSLDLVDALADASRAAGARGQP